LVHLNAVDLWASVDFTERDDRAIALIERALERLPTDDSPARAGLLAALAGQLYYANGPDRCDTTSAEAVDIAERLAEPQLLASVLLQRYRASW